jgi:hypothetical protein
VLFWSGRDASRLARLAAAASDILAVTQTMIGAMVSGRCVHRAYCCSVSRWLCVRIVWENQQLLDCTRRGRHYRQWKLVFNNSLPTNALDTAYPTGTVPGRRPPPVRLPDPTHIPETDGGNRYMHLLYLEQ